MGVSLQNRSNNYNNLMNTTKQPLVSIGIPFYKDASYLSYAILSVLKQSYQNWELILMDDGSTDGSLEIAESFKDERIRVVSDGQNKGLPARLNEIVSLSKGEYVARMDADDIMHPLRIEKQLEYLRNNPKVDVVGTSSYIINDSNQILGRSRPWHIVPKKTADIFAVGSFIHPSVMAKKVWFEENPYDIKLRRMQDLGLWIRTLPFSNFASMKEPLLFYRAVEKNVTKKYLSTQKYSRGFFYQILIKERKEYILGWKLYFKTYLKSLIYIVSYLIGKTDLLVKKRYLALSPSELIEANNSLNGIILK